MKSSINVFIIDDDIPKPPEFTEASVYDKVISSKNLHKLVNSYVWKGLQPLQNLVRNLFESASFKNRQINISAYIHPEQVFDDIEKGKKPDVVVFDWEYGSNNPIASQNWLIDLLSSTDAFIFVYSHVRDSIPIFLNKRKFDDYSSRFQLFLKGSSNNSIFSSEDFIYQYIIGRIENDPVILIDNKMITINQNGYIKHPTDILFIENIIGFQKLKSKLSNISQLNDETIESFLSDYSEMIYTVNEKRMFIMCDAEIFVNKYKPVEKISLKDVLTKIGIIKFKDLVEFGMVKF